MVVAQFLLTFREGLEAALLVGIIAAYLAKVGRAHLNRHVYMGSALAVLASVVLGVAVYSWAGTLDEESWEPAAFEGIAALTAVAVLTYMIFWMAKNSRKLKGEIEQKIDLTLSRGQVAGIIMISFIAVFREGIETVLFLSPYAVTDATATTAGIAVAVALVVALAYLMFRGAYRLDLRRFFTYTSLLLIVFAAGLIAIGVHELNEVHEMTGWGIPAVVDHVWDINGILDEKGVVGSLLASLLGYNGNPSLTEVVAYVSYWAVAGTYALWTYGPGRTRAAMLRVAQRLRIVRRAPADA
jgi:high-affinity iron transporter